MTSRADRIGGVSGRWERSSGTVIVSDASTRREGWDSPTGLPGRGGCIPYPISQALRLVNPKEERPEMTTTEPSPRERAVGLLALPRVLLTFVALTFAAGPLAAADEPAKPADTRAARPTSCCRT